MNNDFMQNQIKPKYSLNTISKINDLEYKAYEGYIQPA